MKMIKELKFLMTGMFLALFASSSVAAQIESEHLNSLYEDLYVDTLMSKLTNNPKIALDVSNELAKCHGFQSAMLAALSDDIEMTLDVIDIKNKTSLSSQKFGVAAVVIRALHSENFKVAHQYAVKISKSERAVWNSRFINTDKKNHIVISMDRYKTCTESSDIVNPIFSRYVSEMQSSDKEKNSSK